MKTWLAFIAITLLVTPALAQIPTEEEVLAPFFNYELSAATPYMDMKINVQRISYLTFIDHSRDGPGGVPELPGIPATIQPLVHTSSYKIEPVELKTGWNVAPAGGSSFVTEAGDEVTFAVTVNLRSQANDPLYEFDINVTTIDSYGTSKNTVQRMVAYNTGLESFSTLFQGGSLRLAPEEKTTAPLKISNTASTVPRQFGIEVIQNDCNYLVSTEVLTIAAGSRGVTQIEIQAPADKIWYNYQNCPIRLNVYSVSAPSNNSPVSISGQVNGVYLDAGHLLAALLAAGIAAVIITFILARKARIEEEILGKPQAPWTIPAEKVYLTHLKKKDQRAWYTVRHYLMEEEYKSAMLWYSAYKRATKGERRHERIIVGHEHVYDRFEQKWAKRMAKPAKMAGRNRGKLEKKVARAMRKAHKSDVRTYRKSVKGVEKAHDKKVKKALKKWSKLAKKSAKKGAHAPPQPHFDAPTHANAPSAAAWSFDDHKLALKEAKFRAKMARKESKLRAQHTREAAKIKAKVRRKVEKLAKKLDDPSFINSLDVLQD
jgi:hypothetical protein